MNTLLSFAVPMQIITIPTVLTAALLILIGSGMIIIWLMDILSGKFRSRGNFFQWTEGEDRLWLHIFAEILTGTVLILSGIGWLLEWNNVQSLSLLGLGALIYSCINSSGWVVNKRSRLKYGIPIWISLAISLFLLINIF